jgi:outer membrane murein-binding lipoprotein Lpp
MEFYREIIEAAVEKMLHKYLAGQLGKLREGQKALAGRMEKLEAKIDRLELRVDQLNSHLDARIDETNKRIDALTREQARLAVEMGHLKTNRAVTADILERLSRV